MDHLEIEKFSPVGECPIVVLNAGEDATAYRAAQALVVGVDRDGLCPSVDARDFDILVTTAESAPRPWLSVAAGGLDGKLHAFEDAVRRTPVAASILRQVLRLNEGLTVAQGLVIESFAYSTALGGAEFRSWRGGAEVDETSVVGPGNVDFARDGDDVTITLSQTDTRNAMTAAMRDALFEALSSVLDDPSEPTVTLRGEGACFSVGGHLHEFGSNTDLAQAHTIRTMRSIAKLVGELGERVRVVFHGACIGSGLEAPAAAAHRAAIEGTFFQLPELKFGLIPGAGGTVTVPHAIGRHRACAMMLTGSRINAATALDWGLVHEVLPRS